jgi:FdhD protein
VNAVKGDPIKNIFDVQLVRVSPDGRAEFQDLVAIEEPLEVRVNGEPFAVIMRTPGADRDLAAGFLLAEGVVQSGDELGTIEHCADADEDGRGNTLNVQVIGEAVARLTSRLRERRQVTMTAACGLCGRRTIDSLRARVASVQGAWRVRADVIRGLPHTLRRAQNAFQATGGLHAAGLFSLDGSLNAIAEDVGRHNAVDKIVGRHLLADALPLDQAMLLVSGRTSFELVQKALLAGIPLIAAVSAPSSLAIALAVEAGITLCGFVRGEAFNIYAHPDRVA